MKRVQFTEQAIERLEEILSFLRLSMPEEAVLQVGKKLLDKAESLKQYPYKGQQEELLQSIGIGHRRPVVDHYKIIYRVTATSIYITDIFDTRQDPRKMYPY